MVQVTVGGRGQLESTQADIVQRFVVDTKGLIRVFDQLVYRQHGIVRFDDRVRDLKLNKFINIHEDENVIFH